MNIETYSYDNRNEIDNMIHFECDRLDLWGGEENKI